MRLAGYLGKVKLFEEHYYSIIRHSRSGYDQERLCAYWLPAQWDEARVNVLPAPVLVFLLNEKLVFQLFDLQPANDYFHHAVKLLPTLPASSSKNSLASNLAKIFFYRGDWQQFEQHLQYIGDTVMKNVLSGVLLFAKGDAKEALAVFDTSTKALRKKVRKNTIYLHNTEGIFHILTLSLIHI